MLDQLFHFFNAFESIAFIYELATEIKCIPHHMCVK